LPVARRDAGGFPLRGEGRALHHPYEAARGGETALANFFAQGLLASDAPDWPRLEDTTADFVYLRLHGATELYASGYGGALDDWAARVALWAAGGEPSGTPRIGPPPPRRRSRDVYAYFDNDAKVQAPWDAAGLARRLGVNPPAAPGAVPIAPQNR
jgi:uncharacterized protein YecE (DUF72 family)